MINTQQETGNWFVDKLSLYQSANSSNDSIKKNFVIRQAEFEIIISELKNKGSKDPLQHELILGRRGSGKSTLLRRIQAEIEEATELHSKYIAINLAEEQASIYRLFDLWEEVLKEIGIKFNTTLNLKDYNNFSNDQDYTRYLYQTIHEILIKEKRKVILLLDNFERIVGNFSDDGNLFRETLLNYNDVQIIAGSTRMDEHFWQYDKPFYEFFRRHRLEALSIKEIIQLLGHWSEVMQLPELANFAKNNIGKIEAIRILTDGLPRTLQFFIQILLQNANLYGYEYLRKVMDNVTALYQERLNNLPAAQRKIIAEMAFIWEACATKELVEKCRMESKLISAHIKQLSNAGIIDVINTEKKNHLYRLSERFFNMWLIVTQGNPEQKRKAKWLSIFLETWYDNTDFLQLANEYINNLENKKISYDKAFVLTKAITQSKYITTIQRDAILELTIALHPYESENSVLELPRKYSMILKEIVGLLEQRNFKNAHELLSEIENEEDGIKFFIKGHIFEQEKKYKESEEYYLLAAEKGNIPAINDLGFLYYKCQNFEGAEKSYLLAFKKGSVEAAFNLGNLYRLQNKFIEAEDYYLKAIKSGFKEAYLNLAKMFVIEKKNEKAENYFLLAIEKGDTTALNDIAVFYTEQNKIEQAKKYLLLAIQKEYSDSYYNLANVFYGEQNYIEAEKYYLLAIQKEHVNASYNLAILYYKQARLVEAEKYYKLAVKKGNSDAAYNLAIMYFNQQKFDASEKYNLIAIKRGVVAALNNLGYLYDIQDKKAEAESYYLLAIEKGYNDALINLAALYNNQRKTLQAEATYFIAIGKGNIIALNNLANLYSSLDRLVEAEKYYLLAIENGYIDTYYNFAIFYARQKNYSEAERYNLLAIQNGNTNAYFNLAVVYTEQFKYKEAEQYFYLAIEHNIYKAFYNLALLYYTQNEKREVSLELISKYNHIVENDKEAIEIQIIIEIWNSDFNDLENKIDNVLLNYNYENADIFFKNLLYHEQTKLVLNLFENKLHSEELQKRYQPLYYAVQLLNNKKENNLELRIPPEISPTVNDILETVKLKQKFYSS